MRKSYFGITSTAPGFRPFLAQVDAAEPRWGATPAIAAATHGHAGVVAALGALGADVNKARTPTAALTTG